MCANLYCGAIIVLVIIIIVILYMHQSTKSNFTHPWGSGGHQCFNYMSDAECIKYMNERKDVQDDAAWERMHKQDPVHYSVKQTTFGPINEKN